MNILQAPDGLVQALPEGPLRDIMAGWGWYVLLAIGGLLILLLLWSLFRAILGGRKSGAKKGQQSLEEDLAQYPPPPARTGDRRLLVEGVPVRIRLVVAAPAGGQADDRLDLEELETVLDQILPGLGAIYKEDKPRVKRWPRQVSYQGFAHHFHRCMLIPEEEGELSPWVLVAGRVKLKKFQMMLGLALLALKPTTVGQRTVDAHEWASVLRVRTRD